MIVQLWSEVEPVLQEPGELCGLAVGFTACASPAAGRVGTAPAPVLEGTRSPIRKSAALGIHGAAYSLCSGISVGIQPDCPSLALSFSERHLP